MLLIYGSNEQKFHDVNDGDNVCGRAFTYYWVYLFFIILVVSILVYNLALSIFAEFIKIQDENKKNYIKLQNTIYPVILAVLAAIFYLIVAIGKGELV